MREIPLTQGFVALVDDADYPALSARSWCISRYPHTIYVRANIGFMHRILLGRPAGDVDHINGDGLDNRRANLRVASRRLNNANSLKRRDGHTSRFKGVCRDNRRGWQVGISIDGRRRSLGSYASEDEAARVYDAAARAAHGEFARVNFPKPGERSALREPIGVS